MLRRVLCQTAVAVSLLLSPVLFSASSQSWAASRDSDDDGKAARKAAAKAVKEAAENGDVKAQLVLGLMHAQGGMGVRHSYKDAAKWWKAASEQGSARATYFLGELYVMGKGVDEDPDMALKLFRKAADKNDAKAQTAMGRLALDGVGMPKNVKQAVEWFNKAVAQNDPGAMTELGILRMEGQGLPQDAKEGTRLFRQAAEMGYGNGEISLAMALHRGVGTPKDDREALMWALIADDQDVKGADKLAENIAQNLSASEQDDAARKAKSWKPKKPGEDGSAADLAHSKGGKEEEDDKSSSAGNGGSKAASASVPAPSSATDSHVVATGTGFFITSDGHVMTNHHVIDGCTRLDAGIAATGFSKAQLVADDPRNDLAVIKLSVSPKAVANFRAGQVRQAESVMVYGFPLTGALASDGNATSGNITALAGLSDDTRFYQTSAPVQPGNSGGPLLDASGNVAGVINSKLDAMNVAKAIHDIPQNVNFAIKGSVATSFLESHGISYNTNSLGTALSPPDLSDKAKSFTVQITCSK